MTYTHLHTSQMSLLSDWQPSGFPLSHFDLRMWLLVIRILQGPASNSFFVLLLLAILSANSAIKKKVTTRTDTFVLDTKAVIHR